MPPGRRPMKRKLPEEKSDKKENVFDFTQDQKELSGSEDEVGQGESVIMDKIAKKRPVADFEDEDGACPVGNEVLTMMEKFGADISKVMQTKKKRLESLTKNYMKGSQQKLEQLWSNYHTQRKKMTEQYSQQVTLALQQWETEAQRTEEQGERLSNLFRQQQKVLQQARVVQNQKLKTVRELYEQFMKNIEDMEKSHSVFLQGAQQELKKEMATLQKKILMDTQQQEMATVRKSLQSMLF
ncbi:synaptonemal complex protein 3 [Sphaeramia orbicularis]|uniref:synaptonemal complex protein 3 n=1 Tax=Sphaeramia orbicularis TaxID=375764 RepID=UPI00117DCE95|nr:synaptonemal complex protein 3 [Sphaeramia orbicularis]